MEDVYHAERGGVGHTPGGAPGEIVLPREAGRDDLIDQFGFAGPPSTVPGGCGEITALGIARIYIGTRAVGVDLVERNAGSHRSARCCRCCASERRLADRRLAD